MKFVILKVNSSEWEYAWNWLASHPINKAIEDPSTALNDGNGWMYMGSYWNGSDKLISEFKHLLHPRTGNKQVLSVEHKEFSQESFEKVVNV